MARYMKNVNTGAIFEYNENLLDNEDVEAEKRFLVECTKDGKPLGPRPKQPEPAAETNTEPVEIEPGEGVEQEASTEDQENEDLDVNEWDAEACKSFLEAQNVKFRKNAGVDTLRGLCRETIAAISGEEE
jgi:hypothetical protein